jgi:hypothetical protein
MNRNKSSRSQKIFTILALLIIASMIISSFASLFTTPVR